jgi:hypothetical protein
MLAGSFDDGVALILNKCICDRKRVFGVLLNRLCLLCSQSQYGQGAAPQGRASTSSSNPFDIAPSLRTGNALLHPHSVGSMGGAAASEVDFWGSPSLGSSAMGTRASGAASQAAQAQARSAGGALGPHSRRQPSIDVRGLPQMAGSLYNAFYSGLDVSATPPQSLPRSGPIAASAVTASGASAPVGTPTPRPNGSLTLTMGPRQPDSGSSEHL